MPALRRPRLIPLAAALVVVAIFVGTLFVARPGPSPIAAEDRLAPPAMLQEAPSDTMMAQVTADAPPPPESALPGEPPASAEIAPVEVSLPKLAYAYTLGFRLDGARIAEAQEAHRALCERMGPARCQMVAMRRGEADDTQTSAHLKLRVATGEARGFSDTVTKMVAEAGGRPVQTSVVTEDVSRQIVDAVARIRQREMLVARLTEILRTRRGTVSELVEAERSVAAAQEELDQTRAWLAELRGRVAMSDFEITYSAVAPQASPRVAKNQLGEAIWSSGQAFFIALRSLLTLLIYLTPWALLLGAIGYGVYRFRRFRPPGIAPLTQTADA